MDNNTYFKFCINACIFIMVVNFCLIFVSSLNVFPVTNPTKIISTGVNSTVDAAGKMLGDTTGDKTNTNLLISLVKGNFISVLAGGGLFSIGLIGTIILSRAVGSWNVLAAYVFAVIFWATWGTNIVLLDTGGYLSGSLIMIELIITMMFLFIFIGAIIGILKFSSD